MKIFLIGIDSIMRNTPNPLKKNYIESNWLAVGHPYYDHFEIHIIVSCL